MERACCLEDRFRDKIQAKYFALKRKRQQIRGYTCWLAASLDSAKSGHIFSSKKRQDDTSITDPAINSRCHNSKLTGQNGGYRGNFEKIERVSKNIYLQHNNLLNVFRLLSFFNVLISFLCCNCTWALCFRKQLLTLN